MTHWVKRYGGVRLYDTATLAYTNTEILRALRAKAVTIIVTDAATGQDVTRDVLQGR